MKRQLSEWEEIFANEATNMALISKTYKQLIELSIKIVNSLIKNWVEDLNRYFSKKKKKRHTNGQRAHEKMLNITNT